MPDEKQGIPQPIANLPVNIIGVRTEGTGAPIVDGQVIVTPDHQPNLVVRVITPIVAIAIRAANLFLASVIGFLSATMIPAGDNPVLKALHAMEFYQLVMTAAGLAIAPTVFGALKDLATIGLRLEKKFPLLTGSV